MLVAQIVKMLILDVQKSINILYKLRVYHIYSRCNDYSDSFGMTVFRGTLTPHLAPAFAL